MRIIAHRGASARAPENTLAAFRLALRAGVRMIELDVHLTSDGVPVVIHDATLSRTTNGEGRVAERTLADLRRLSAGVWFDERFREERVPALEEVFRQVGGQAEINVEIKGGAEAVADTARAAVAIAREAGALDRTLFSSFDPDALTHCRRESATARLALLTGPNTLPPSSAADPADLNGRVRARQSAWRHLGLEAANLHRALASPPLVRSLHGEGYEVCLYTVDEPSAVEAFDRMGVDGVFANDPAPLLARWPPDAAR
jgi:glycerophosphoryl diester phosphodiesterase